MDDDDQGLVRVVVNDEEQYAFLPSDRELPRGWHDTGTVATVEECSAVVSSVWTDLRPRSVRLAMDGAEPDPSE